ncbi:hypothetical protein DFH06DRAFT_904811, partial [Mycena polygramma]
FVLVAVLLKATSAQDLIAFDGTACNGASGLDVPCDGTCFDFAGRHSFEASGKGQAMTLAITSASRVCVTMWEGPSCTSEMFNFGSEGQGVCINVVTGTPVDS